MSRAPLALLLAAILWSLTATAAAPPENNPDPGRPVRFNEGELDEKQLEYHWNTLYEKYNNTPEDDPERDAIWAEMTRTGDRQLKLMSQRLQLPDRPDEDRWNPRRPKRGDNDPKPLAQLAGPSATSTAFSSDGRIILLAGAHEAHLYDATTYQRAYPPLDHGAGIWAASFSRDSSRLLTAGGQEVRVWDAATGKRILTLKLPARVRAAAFRPDGRLIATGSDDHAVRLWNATNGAAVDKVPMDHAGDVRFVAFTPDGDTLLSCDLWRPVRRWDARIPAGQGVKAWHVASGNSRWSDPANAHNGWRDVAVSPDGRAVVAVNDEVAFGRIYKASNGRETATFHGSGHERRFRNPAFSPDGRLLAVAGSGDVQFFDPATGQRSGEKLGGQTNENVGPLAFSPDGKRLLVCAESNKSLIPCRTAGVWDVATRRQMLPFGEDAFNGGFNPAGDRLVIAIEWLRVRPKDPAKPGPDDAELQGIYEFDFDYDKDTGRWSMRQDRGAGDEKAHYAHFQNSGKPYPNDHEWKESALARRLILRSIDEAQLGIPAAPPPGAKPAPQVERLLSPRIAKLPGAGLPVFSPDGRFFAITAFYSKVIIADSSTGEKVLDATGKYVRSGGEFPVAAFSPDSTRIAVSYHREDQVTLWSLPAHKPDR